MAKTPSSILIPAFGLLLASATSAHAIFGVGDLVSDPPVEAATAAIQAELGITNTALAAIQTSDALTAASVTTPCDPGLYQGVAQYLDGLEGLFLGTGISTTAMAALFPGWVPLLPDSIPGNATIATMGLGAFGAAVQVAESQAADFDAENTYLASIEAANVGASGMLCAQQINSEVGLAIATQLQMLRQLMATSIIVDAYDHAENLNEKAQSGATTAQATNLGVPPQ